MENTNCFNFGGQDSMLEDTAGRNMTANQYDGNSTYTKGAICIQNNKLYEANQNIDVAEQFTEAHWTETTLGDIVSKNKSDISVLNEKTKEVYKSEAPFAVSQTVHMSCIENDSENSVYLISSYRYASAGSMVLTRKDIVEGNWGEGFTIFANNPEHYWVFKLTPNFDLTLVTNYGWHLPYISVTRI